MAIVTGPLMSMEASGQFGKTLVFGNRLGKNVVRKLVVPSNPRSADQTTARNIQRVAAAGQHWANSTALVLDGESSTDKVLIAALTPSGQRWNSYLVFATIGAGQINYDAAFAIWDALAAGEQTAWDNAAAALTPAFPAVAQKVAVTNADGTPITGGQAFFHYMYALYVLGITTVPTATPPTYA
jgi:hypothetical protein